MAGGYWGKGNNPYWNYDHDAANSRQRANNAESESQRARIDTIKAQSDASLARSETELAYMDVSRIRNQLNTTINSHQKVVTDYEQRLEEQKTISFKLIMKVNIFERTLNRLQEQWPEKKESILDEIQRQKDHCSVEEYKEKWWKWVNDGSLTPEANCLKFPYPEREIKNKP
ncbi:hypothetical protein QF51_25625 [Salmonella enterica subsp. diarizonae]|nr:hypothetical protein [Salmonella enterica subsp. diarizonae]ECF6072431.1 hypothetical protein [Salmonella enterica subsp. diarizonae]